MSTEPSAVLPTCVGIGEVLWDLLPGGKALGGAPVNVVAHAAQLGLRALAVSAVGADVLGQEILDRLSAMRVDAGRVRIADDLPTGVVDVRLDAAGVPTFDIRFPSAWDALVMDPKLADLAIAADAVVFGTLAQRDPRSRGCIRAFLRSTRPKCLRLLDINLRHPFYSAEIVVNSFELANVLKLNDGELHEVARLLGWAGEEGRLLERLRAEFGFDLVILTRGAKGSRLLAVNQNLDHPGYPAKVTDTVGAGDAFTAAVIVGLLRGIRMAELQDLANRVASCVCSQAGAVPPLPEALVHEFMR
jgi:fructokinase